MWSTFPFLLLCCLLVQFRSVISIACSNDIAGEITIIEDGVPVTAYIAQTGGDNKQLIVSGASLTVRHNTRAMLAAKCENFSPTMFKMLYLMGKTLSFDVDMSQVSCGCNAAVYFNQMPARDQYGQYTPSSCNDYYCDANAVCGVLCPEHDFVEANRVAYAAASHRCVKHDTGYYTDCDKGGCSKNFIKMNPSSYGPGSSYTINTDKSYNVAVSFESADGHNLDRIVTKLSQSGRSISMVHDDSTCPAGEMEGTAQPLRDGTVLAFSLWGNEGSLMGWLDIPPCHESQACDTSKSVTYSNIRISSNAATPSPFPTRSPTAKPTPAVPTQVPTRSPTFSPTRSPTRAPTLTPTAPTFSPTVAPTAAPTCTPTAPTCTPTCTPSSEPTMHPTHIPTSSPTVNPTAQPTFTPTSPFPTLCPTVAPTASPTVPPTFSPTASPTVHPTFHPTESPTFEPTRMPFSPPTFAPTSAPTVSPTFAPTTALRTQLKFSASHALNGVDSSSLQENDLRAFEGAVADSMEHVEPNNVAIVSVSSARRRLLDSSAITYAITVIIEEIGFKSASAAYTSLKQQLQSAVNSGAFETALKARLGEGSAMWSIIDSTVVVSESYSEVILQTPYPTIRPTVAPKHEEKGLVDQALSFSSPGGVLLSIFVLFVIVTVIFVAVQYYRDRRFKQKRRSSLYLSQLTTPTILMPASSNRMHRYHESEEGEESDGDDFASIDEDEMTAEWSDVPVYQKRQFSRVMSPDEDDLRL